MPAGRPARGTGRGGRIAAAGGWGWAARRAAGGRFWRRGRAAGGGEGADGAGCRRAGAAAAHWHLRDAGRCAAVRGFNLIKKGGGAPPVSGFKGYAGGSLEFLRREELEVGDRIRVAAGDDSYAGTIMPRYESHGGAPGGDGEGAPAGGRLVIKLDNGYNIGIEIDGITGVERGGAGGGQAGDPAAAGAEGERSGRRGAAGPSKGGLPRILLLSTGGTIASRIDYRTGAVTPAVTAEELGASVPELAGIAGIEPRILFSEYSENIEPEHWLRLAGELDSSADAGYAGIIVAHGTDTMQYTASYVSFALRGYPVPIAFVGSQRSSDRPSSDAALNLVAAARLIASGRAGRGVYVVMHMDGSDSAGACHLATRVRKCHTSKRDAFRTIGAAPAFVVRHDGGGAVGEGQEGGRGGGRGDYFGGSPYSPSIAAGKGAVLVKCHPGYDPAALEHAVDTGRCRAIIFEGTGLGHVGRPLYRAVRKAAGMGIFMGMTSQCIEGRVGMTVYESGRDLLAMGIVPLGDMLAETAFAKAVWALGEAGRGGGQPPLAAMRKAMLRPLASEFTPD